MCSEYLRWYILTKEITTVIQKAKIELTEHRQSPGTLPTRLKVPIRRPSSISLVMMLVRQQKPPFTLPNPAASFTLVFFWALPKLHSTPRSHPLWNSLKGGSPSVPIYPAESHPLLPNIKHKFPWAVCSYHSTPGHSCAMCPKKLSPGFRSGSTCTLGVASGLSSTAQSTAPHCCGLTCHPHPRSYLPCYNLNGPFLLIFIRLTPD